MTAQASGQLGKTDGEQLDYAIGKKSAILTHNRSEQSSVALIGFGRSIRP